MTQALDPRLQAGLMSVQANDPVTYSPFTRSLLEAIAGYFDGRLRWQHWYYPLFNARHPGAFLYWHTTPRPETFGKALDTARWMLTGTLINLYVHNLIIEWLKAPLVLLGVWDEFAARLDTHLTQMQSETAPMRGFVEFESGVMASLLANELPDDPDFRDEWEQYLVRHGHCAPNELDLAVPRLRETPERIIDMILQAPRRKPPRTLPGLLLFPLGWLASHQIDQRDRFMFHAALAYDNMRQHLLKLAQAAVERGQLDHADAIWDMDIDSIHALDETG